jgi:predicted acetyltransferase
MTLNFRHASDGDVGLLAEWNRQLIRDEGHRNPMTVDQLAARMKKWLETEYEAVVFSNEVPVGYALFKKEESLIYLRHFFVRRDIRRTGVGRAAFDLMRREICQSQVRLTVDVLSQNAGGVAFWRSVGYRDYSLTLEIMPT